MQPWPGEVLEERAGEIAVGFAALLTRQAAWRHRRVETITVLSHEQVRRSVSVDFTVPAGAPRGRAALGRRSGSCRWRCWPSASSCTSTCAWRTRAACRCCAPTRRSSIVPRVAVPAARPRPGGLRRGGVRRRRADRARARRRARGGRSRRAPRSPRWRTGCRASPRSPSGLARGFLLCAVVGDVSRRRVIKFAYDEPLARPGRWSHFFGTPGCTEAASYHVELAVPDGDARPPDADGGQPDRRGARLGPARRRPPGGCTTSPRRAHGWSRACACGTAPSARGFLVPAALVALGDRARARAAVAVRRPAGAGANRAVRRSRSCSPPRRCSRASCCAAASIRWCR